MKNLPGFKETEQGPETPSSRREGSQLAPPSAPLPPSFCPHICSENKACPVQTHTPDFPQQTPSPSSQRVCVGSGCRVRCAYVVEWGGAQVGDLCLCPGL